MTTPPTTYELYETAGLALQQAGDILHQLCELHRLVELTGVELADATRHEIHTDLHASLLALHTVQLGVHEPRRGAPR